MKKILLSIICFLMFGVVNAAEVNFTYPKTVKKGEEFEIRLVINNANNLKYVKATNYRFDSDKITTVDFDTLNGFIGLGSGNSPYTSIGTSTGFLMNNTTGKSGKVEVLYLKFKVKDSAAVGDKINIRMSEVFISSNEDGSNQQNISNQDGYCITVTVVGDTVVENPKCEYKNNKYYDNNGNVVTKQEYERACNKQEVVENPKCEYKNNKYYDNNGNVVTKQEYERACNKQEIVENPKCEYKNNKYYDNNGNVVTKDVYEQLCGNPETGFNSTIIVVIAATLFTIGCYTFFKKNKMYY